MKKIILVFAILFLAVGFVGAFENSDEVFEDFMTSEAAKNEESNWFLCPWLIVQDLETVDYFCADEEAWAQQNRMTVIRYKYRDGEWVETTSEHIYRVYPVKNSDGEKVWRDKRFPSDKAVDYVPINGGNPTIISHKSNTEVIESFYTYYIEEDTGNKIKVAYVYAGEPIEGALMYYRFDNPNEWGMTPHNPKEKRHNR